MNIIVFGENSYECARAVKGVDYIKLYDENNNIIVAFYGISDFSAFTLQEGEWEQGVSTETVAADASVDGEVNIVLTLLKPTSVETGLTVTFKAPCDCTETKSIIIQGKSFSLVDALGVSIASDVQAFVSGAMVAIILNCEDLAAYIQNAASASQTFTALVPNKFSWSKKTPSSGIYYYDAKVTIDGILKKDNPIVDVVLGSDTEVNKLHLSAWECISRITTSDGYIMLYAYDNPPETAFNIQLKAVR